VGNFIRKAWSLRAALRITSASAGCREWRITPHAQGTLFQHWSLL
jgi:hypothetical protein